MANPEQLELLKSDVKAWNKWRKEEQPLDSKIDLFEADLIGKDLRGASLSNANLQGGLLSRAILISAYLREANLGNAHLDEADLNSADLSNGFLGRADLSHADLRSAKFCDAYLQEANLSHAQLDEANLRVADLSEANLNGARLIETDLRGALLGGAKFTDAFMGSTALDNLDLSVAEGLETVSHGSPSTIGTDTIRRSKGKIPEIFLRGCGLSDIDIEYAKIYNPDLTNEEINKIVYRIYDLRATQAFQISPLFISYSHADSTFVDALENGLNRKGVRFWRDIHQMTSGRIETQIDRAIRQNPTVLLVLSKNSLNSDWVQHEVRKARDLEKELERDALCPIALDDSWKSSNWPQRIMEQVMEYNVLDFSGWKNESEFQSKFAKLLSGLDLFYKKPKT